MGEAKRREKLG